MLDKIIYYLKKIVEKLSCTGALIIDKFFEVYGWRGFILRLVYVFILYYLSIFREPEYMSGRASGKYLFVSCCAFIFAIGKLVYDYTKLGKASEEKKKSGKKNN
jgi:hypothetical protein